MAYIDVGAAAKGVDFQNRVRGSIISLASLIIAAAEGSNAVETAAHVDLTTEPCKNLAINFCKGTNLFTLETAAMFLLLDSGIAASPDGIADGNIQYQTREIWLQLVDIG